MKTTTLLLALLSVAVSTSAAQQTSGSQGSCWDVSVDGDATFCVPGPVCSGSGSQPTGANCPRVGDVAVADCWDNVPSYSNNSCVAPVNAECELLDSGAWGCVWVTGGNSSGSGSFNGSSSGSGSGSVSVNATSAEAQNPEDIQFPQSATTLSSGSSSSSDSSTGVVVVVIVAVAAIAAAAFYRRRQTQRQEVCEYENAIFTPAKGHGPLNGKTPLTPPPRDMRNVFTRTNV